MKFKFHWGWGVGITYSLFALTFLVILYLSTGLNNDLEDRDYYQKEINYQKQIEKINRTQSLPEKIKLEILKDNIVIKFPDYFKGKNLTGTIHFYRPSDEKKDFRSEIKLDEYMNFIIPINALSNGLWRLKVDFKSDNLEYYYEEAIKV